MVLSVKLSEEVAVRLGATAEVTLAAPPALRNEFLGRAAFQDIEAVVTPTGIIIAFELEPEEVQSIRHGKNQFLMHIHSTTGVFPFRLIFEKMELGVLNGDASGGQKSQNEENTDDRLSDSEPSKED